MGREQPFIIAESDSGESPSGVVPDNPNTIMNTKGYLPHNVVKGIVFWVLAACIVFATASGILRSWGTIGEEVANNCLSTTFILALGSIAFVITNYLFGDLGHMLMGQGDPPQKLDPAFSECLRKSKVESQPGERSAGTDERVS